MPIERLAGIHFHLITEIYYATYVHVGAAGTVLNGNPCLIHERLREALTSVVVDHVDVEHFVKHDRPIEVASFALVPSAVLRLRVFDLQFAPSQFNWFEPPRGVLRDLL